MGGIDHHARSYTVLSYLRMDELAGVPMALAGDELVIVDQHELDLLRSIAGKLIRGEALDPDERQLALTYRTYRRRTTS